MSEPVAGVVSRGELVRLRGEVRDAAGGQVPQLDLPPGEDEPQDHIVCIYWHLLSCIPNDERERQIR